MSKPLTSREAIDKLSRKYADLQRAAGKEVRGEQLRREVTQIATDAERKNPHLKKSVTGGER
jgi:hypothetical protein